jgi:hypothetical protein
MKKYIPMVQAFGRYDSPEDIEKDYPGIFDPEGHTQHIRESDEGWLVEDKHAARESASRRLTVDEMRSFLEDKDG